MNQPLYFDYAATAPLDPLVIEAMIKVMKEVNGNPASRSHVYGWEAEELIENARHEVAKLIHADPKEIIWTSGATESDKLAIKGVAQFYQRKGKHIITTQIEHKAVLDTCRQLEREGFEVTYLAPCQQGLISVEKIREAIREDTILVSVMHANNEIGAIQDIESIGRLTREKGIIFHVDAAQTVGKIPLNMEKNAIDLLSISAHKLTFLIAFLAHALPHAFAP